MKKLLTILLTLFLFSSVYADERMSKDDLLKQWDGKVVTMIQQRGELVSFEVYEAEVLHIINKDSPNTDVWIRDNGKLCIEYHYNDDCQWVIKKNGTLTFAGDFDFKERVLIVSNNINEAITTHSFKSKSQLKEIGNRMQWNDLIVVALLLLFLWIVTNLTKTWFTKEADWVSVISYIFVVIWISAAFWAFVWLLGMGGVIFD